MSSNYAHGEMYSIQHYVLKFASNFVESEINHHNHQYVIVYNIVE